MMIDGNNHSTRSAQTSHPRVLTMYILINKNALDSTQTCSEPMWNNTGDKQK